MASEPRNDRRRAARHLRVGVIVTERAVRVGPVWLVEEPPVHLHAFAHPIVASVEVAGVLMSVEAHADPRITRSTFRPEVGHHLGRTGKGTVYLSVPFARVGDLSDVKIRVSDFSDVPIREPSAESLSRLLANPEEGMREVHELSSADLRSSPDWPDIATALGLPEAGGVFEIYLDRQQRYRWRLLRGEREIVADSGQGYRTREACLNDLNWIRGHASSARVTSADVGPR